METIYWGVRFNMEVGSNWKLGSKTKKKRSQRDEVGRLKYNRQLLKQTLAEIEEVKLILRTILRVWRALLILSGRWLSVLLVKMKLTERFCVCSVHFLLLAPVSLKLQSNCNILVILISKVKCLLTCWFEFFPNFIKRCGVLLFKVLIISFCTIVWFFTSFRSVYN